VTRTLSRLATVLALLGAALLVPASGATPANSANAANLSFFDPGNIIADAVFYDYLSMSTQDVQAFLNVKGAYCQPGTDGTPCIKNYSLTTTSRSGDGLCRGYQGAANETAATVITKVAVSCGVSPRVFLVLLQKEMGLITGTRPTAKKYERAAGYACPDSANGGCDPTYAGLMNQLYRSGWQYKRYQAYPGSYSYRAGRDNTIAWNPDPSCGSSTVYIANQATAGLYNYTPYLPNQAALNAGYGTGDSCSAYGNRNFWNYFTDWFGSTQSQGGAAIYAKYESLGSDGGTLGGVVSPFICGLSQDGCYQVFQNGSIYWTPSTGANASTGALRDRWGELGWENGRLHYPTSDTICGLANGGCYQLFQGGSLYSSASTPVRFVMGGIREKWDTWGLENGPLGYPLSDELGGLVRGGSYQVFQHGSIYWSPATGAHMVTGALRDRWGALGWENGGLGYPTSDSLCGLINGGCYQLFQGGSLYSSAPGAAAYLVFGGIREKWNAWGLENGPLGYPLSDEHGGLVRGGSYQVFQHGSIYWSPATGAHKVTDALADRYAALGAENGGLGYPTSDTLCGLVGGGCYQLFENGSLYSTSPTAPAYFVLGGIRQDWVTWGLENGPLGYPLSDEYTGLIRDGHYQVFQSGSIYWSPTTGAHMVTGAIRDRWASMGAENGSLGYPIADPASDGSGTVQRFEKGTLKLDPGTGVVTLIS
jgi:uncharacterized protein with LGFP repeats